MTSGWLFRDLVSQPQRRGRAVDLEKATQAVERLHVECVWLIRCWAFFEVLNGYPTVESGQQRRDNVNLAGEGHGLNVISNVVIREAISTIFRMLEDDAKDRLNLSSIASFLTRVERSGLLTFREAPKAFRQPHRKADWTFMDNIFERLKDRLLVEDKNSKSTLIHHRAAVKDFRDRVIAHSMSHLPYGGVTLFQLRDCVVFLSACAVDSLLLLKGTSWNPKERWRIELNDAKIFWNRYEQGFRDNLGALAR